MYQQPIKMPLYDYCADRPRNVKLPSSSLLQLLPYLVMDILSGYPGLPGVFVAALFSGALRLVAGTKLYYNNLKNLISSVSIYVQ